ncbi:MAG: penicillin-binding transpeptidase domain-containing protein [Candidatus Gracilibacteria bacterium]|nr:penicillin-binding transpeptidase domain-containing protein [Candidatus Gracilibacteria bacterium]
MYVKDYLVKEYGEDFILKGGLRIYTTIDPKLQDKAEEIIIKQVKENTKKYNAKNSALISIDSKNGNILSMVGGVDYFDKENGGFNNMTLARLQPGSAFKPFIYTLAMIKKGFWAGSILEDNYFIFPGGYSPRNSDGTYLGKITFSKALNYSRNITAVKLYYSVGGEKEIISFIDKLGIKSVGDFKKEYKNKYNKRIPICCSNGIMNCRINSIGNGLSLSNFANNGLQKKLKPITKNNGF